MGALNRRALFFAPLGLAAGAAQALASAEGAPAPRPGGRRISTVKYDAGERFFAECQAAGRYPKIFLDGVEQKRCVTADEAQGYIVRFAAHPKHGGPFVVNDEVVEERVFGRVEIRFD